MARREWQGGFVRGAPTVDRAVDGLLRPDAGALAVLAPMARDVDLMIIKRAGTSKIFQRALQEGRSQGALAGRILHGTGRIPAGRPMVVLAAVARNRKDSLLAVETMLNALKGVADRRDASKE